MASAFGTEGNATGSCQLTFSHILQLYALTLSESDWGGGGRSSPPPPPPILFFWGWGVGGWKGVHLVVTV